MDSSIYEVYALRYAMHEGRKASENFLSHDDQHSGPMPLSFYLWAIKGTDRTVIVDTGFDEGMARKRGRTFLHSPKDLLSDIGINAEDVTDVVITHMHYDHCGNLGLFPNARYHIQEAEMAYCTGRAMTYALLRRPFEPKNIKEAIDCLFQDRLVVRDGDVDLGGGIRLHKVGGHTKGMQIVSIPTLRGNLVLASDAAHFWANLNRRSPFPIVVDVQEMFAAYDVMERLADGPFHVIPGHDPKVLEVFPCLPSNPDIALLHETPADSHGSRPIANEESTNAVTVSRIAIVGMGPRGISVLEQLIKNLDKERLAGPVEILMIDPGPCGEGAHSSNQHEDLLINTVASQVSIFGVDSLVNGAPGPSLTEWARQAGYRHFGNRYRISYSGDGGAIGDADYLPRRLLGEYLGWAFEQITRSLPNKIQIRHIRRRIIDLRAVDEESFSLVLDEGSQLTANYVVLATGHGNRTPTEADLKYQSFACSAAAINPRAAYYKSPYPAESLGEISERSCVAVQGMGLTAYDVISSLTSARGGLFREDGAQLEYLPSGKEPRILLVSRNCLPFAARGINQKGLTGSHQAAFFTLKAVEYLRLAAALDRGDRHLNFEDEVLPLIKLEMAYAYRLALQEGKVDPAWFVPTDEEREAIDRLLDPLAFEEFSSLEHFRSYFRSHVEEDLYRHAYLGNLTSPIKAAADVLRDTREALRAAVEFGGLTPSSHRAFVETFVATTNRISFGPPKQRNAELLALMDAGVLSVAGGPGNEIVLDRERWQFCIVSRLGKEPEREYADVLVSARLDLYSPLTDSSPLASNLLAGGVVRPYSNGDYHPGGLDITQDLRVIDAKGCPHEHLWAIGIPVEGPHFYTHALPRPSKASRFSLDAEQCAQQIADRLARSYSSPSVMDQLDAKHEQQPRFAPALTDEVAKQSA